MELGLVRKAYHPATQETETVRLQAQDQLGLHRKFTARLGNLRRSCFKMKWKKQTGDLAQ